eukprot:554304_1
MSTHKKRSYNHLDITSTYEPQSKKQKLCKISSALFPNQADHHQFETIFNTIDNSQLIKSMEVCHFINKNIAEYATGYFEDCFNNKCTNKIPILFQDGQIYNNNHNNAHKIGYKYDILSNQ